MACSRAEQLAWNSNVASYLLTNGISQPTTLQVTKLVKLDKTCLCSQAHAWPAITALRSVVMVGSRGQGKTVLSFLMTMIYPYFSSPQVGWLLPMLSQLCDTASYSALIGAGPLAVVLCSSHEEAGQVARIATSLIAATGVNLRMSVTRSGPVDPNPSHVANGCDLLVTTAPRLIKLLDKSIANMNRCSYYQYTDP